MRLTHRIGLKTLKTKLQCSPCEPTKAHITAKEFVMSLLIGLLQVYVQFGHNGERKFTTFLVICPKNGDENLIHAAKIAQTSAIFRRYKQE